MDIIRLLPDSVANQIAAGEVIQRPASVVKELVENSVDAGATTILINIKDAGRTLIQIVDNGCGMSMTDARMAFERHATSKIREATDLFSLHTMGFRGEALPSVAAVSEIDMRSMRRDDEMGTHIEISASKVTSQRPEAMVPGTNIMVKRLFFNLPARRKFLKKDSVELSHIVREFERLALVNTNVEFTLTHNDVLLHKLSPGTLKQRIIELFGKTFEHQLLPMSTSTSLVQLEGFVSLPGNARKRGAQQFFFVNGRYMRHPYFHKAVLKCYEDLIPSDAQPNYFINFKVDADTIDVNIHPQKYEIKFENEQPIWQILVATVKEALGRFQASGALDFDAVDVPDIPAFNPEEAPDSPLEESDTDLNYNPFTRDHMRSGVSGDWQKLYTAFTSPAADVPHVRGSRMNSVDTMPSAIGSAPIEEFDAPLLDVPLIEAEETTPDTMFQVKNRYIVTSAPTGILVIDQHRAHTLILYDKYMQMVETGSISSQRLIFPDSVTLDAAQNVIISSIGETLTSMGFDISDLGDCTWSINAVPAMLDKTSPTDALLNILNAVAEQDEDIQQSHWQKIALSVARSAAVKYGDRLTADEMRHIVSQLLRLPEPSYTPDGKTVLAKISLNEINRLF